jgi:hypothetical protein
VDGRVRQQALGHLPGALACRRLVGGLQVYLEAVGRAQVPEFEPEAFEGLLGRLGLRVEYPALQPDGHRRRVGCHWLCMRGRG